MLILDFTCFLLFPELQYYYPGKFVRRMTVMHRIFIFGLVSDLKTRKLVLHSREWIDSRTILFCFHHSRSLILLIFCFFFSSFMPV